mmetsp:Transcript_77889/g.130791  ORF Transcript_77889/g.130791 Transcript_77889/m.130791 type:complete len:218 (-) Transcript_77889:1517-2170(-)
MGRGRAAQAAQRARPRWHAPAPAPTTKSGRARRAVGTSNRGARAQYAKRTVARGLCLRGCVRREHDRRLPMTTRSHLDRSGNRRRGNTRGRGVQYCSHHHRTHRAPPPETRIPGRTRCDAPAHKCTRHDAAQARASRHRPARCGAPSTACGRGPRPSRWRGPTPPGLTDPRPPTCPPFPGTTPAASRWWPGLRSTCPVRWPPASASRRCGRPRGWRS